MPQIGSEETRREQKKTVDPNVVIPSDRHSTDRIYNRGVGDGSLAIKDRSRFTRFPGALNIPPIPRWAVLATCGRRPPTALYGSLPVARFLETPFFVPFSRCQWDGRPRGFITKPAESQGTSVRPNPNHPPPGYFSSGKEASRHRLVPFCIHVNPQDRQAVSIIFNAQLSEALSLPSQCRAEECRAEVSAAVRIAFGSAHPPFARPSPFESPRGASPPTVWILRPRRRGSSSLVRSSSGPRCWDDPIARQHTCHPSDLRRCLLLYAGDLWTNSAAVRLTSHVQLRGRISTMIQNFERAEPSRANSNSFLTNVPPQTPALCCACFYQQVGEPKRTKVRIPLPSLEPPNPDTQDRPTKDTPVRSFRE